MQFFLLTIIPYSAELDGMRTVDLINTKPILTKTVSQNAKKSATQMNILIDETDSIMGDNIEDDLLDDSDDDLDDVGTVIDIL